MKYYIFKSPRKQGAQPLETLNSEPLDYLIAQKSIKYGPIIIVSEEELLNEKKEDLNI